MSKMLRCGSDRSDKSEVEAEEWLDSGRFVGDGRGCEPRRNGSVRETRSWKARIDCPFGESRISALRHHGHGILCTSRPNDNASPAKMDFAELVLTWCSTPPDSCLRPRAQGQRISISAKPASRNMFYVRPSASVRIMPLC